MWPPHRKVAQFLPQTIHPVHASGLFLIVDPIHLDNTFPHLSFSKQCLKAISAIPSRCFPPRQVLPSSKIN